MIPQAGAILAMRGKMPANSAEPPSVRTIRNRKGILENGTFDDDMTKDWRRVFKTSKGEVINAARVPLNAPLRKATEAPSCPCLAKALLHDS
jgi:hypothetical protein